MTQFWTANFARCTYCPNNTEFTEYQQIIKLNTVSVCHLDIFSTGLEKLIPYTWRPNIPILNLDQALQDM